MANKYRLSFSKTGDAQFISHLDLMRLFSRVWRRAELPLAYSEGFNPHPKMSIGLPLSVGVTSSFELLDVELSQPLDPAALMERVNAVMPIGVTVTGCTLVDDTFAKLSDVTAADYTVTLSDGTLSSEEAAAFLAREEIIVEKRTKRGCAPANIRPDILRLEADGKTLTMTLHAGSQANLKPDTVLTALRQYVPGFCCTAYQVHRTGAACSNGKRLI